MKITKVGFEKASFEFIWPVKVSFGTLYGFDSVILKIETSEGIVGYGEASPFPFLTGDSIDTVFCVGKEISKKLIGEDPLLIGRIHSIMDSMYTHNGSVKAAYDMALYDIAAKKMGEPLYKFLEGYTNQLETDATIGIDIPEEMARVAEEWVKKGFRNLKIKLGDGWETDVERICKIREIVGDNIRMRADINQGWTVKEAIKAIRAMEPYKLEVIEQPIVYWDIEGLREIKSKVDTPIVADESCHTAIDASVLTKAKAVDGINIKLMKCGGIYKARKINSIAEANGIFCMIGCMGESRIANIAGMHFAAAHKNIKIIDLDTVFNIKCDYITGGFTNEGSTVCFTDEPGLGLTISRI